MAGLGEYEDVRAQGIEGESLLAHESDFAEEDYVRKKNWPVCKPILYHNIVRDIDDAKLRHAVRVCYYLWYVLLAAFIINTLAVGAAFLSITDAHWSNWIGLILSLFYFVVCWPLAFVVYYYLGYEGARLRSSVKMGTFFCAFPAQIILCAWLALGITQTGGGGLVLLVHAWEGAQMGTGVLNAMSFLIWILTGLSSAYVMYMTWRAWRQVRASGPQPHPQTEGTSIEDDDARDTFIDVEEEVAAAKAKETASEGSASTSSTSAFSSWGVPTKLNLSLASPIARKEKPAQPAVEAHSPPAPAAASNPQYVLPTNFLE